MNTTNTLTVTSEHFRDLEGFPVAYLKLATISEVQTYLSVADDLEIPNDKYVVLTIQENQLLTKEFIEAMPRNVIIRFVDRKTATANYYAADSYCTRAKYFISNRKAQTHGGEWIEVRGNLSNKIDLTNAITLDEYLCAVTALTLNRKIADCINDKQTSEILAKEQATIMAQKFLEISAPLIQSSLDKEITVGYIVSDFPRLDHLVDEVSKYSASEIRWRLGDEGSKTIRWELCM